VARARADQLPFPLGLIGALQFGPILLFSFLSGAISDRVHKRRLLVGTQTALMLPGLHALGAGVERPRPVLARGVLAALYGLATTLDMPARQAFMRTSCPART
jgi:MFS family permease